MGRPVGYDEAAVVTAALDQFWEAGFKASSVDQLIAGTGLNKHSLYQAFGGKAGLFVRVLEEYLAGYTEKFLTIFERESGSAALRLFFQSVLADTDPRGCLVVNAAVELGESDPDVQRLITDYYAQMTRCFAVAIAQGQTAGHIRAALDPNASAVWLVRAVQGLAVSARLGTQAAAEVRAILALLIDTEPAAPRRHSRR